MENLFQRILTPSSSQNFFLILSVVTFLAMTAWEYFSTSKRVEGSVRYRSYLTNLTGLVFNNLILTIVSVKFFYLLASYRSLNVIPRLGEITDIAPLSPAGIIIQFVILDFLIYVWHVMNHKFNFLWNFHKAHHCDHDLNTTTGIRFHIGELILSLFYKGGIILILGVPPELVVGFEFITIYAALFHHSNIRIPGENLLRYLLIMPSHHATHHSVPRRHHDSNYGVVFSFWDYAFRTRNPHQPLRFGLAKIPELSFPQLLRFSFPIPYLTVILTLTSILFLMRWYYGQT